MYVTVDGPTMSLLLYSHFNSQGKQMGFLLGQRMEKVQSDITDSQIHTAQVHSYIYVTSFIPWPQHKSLYGRNGYVDEQVLHEVLDGFEQQVVGWYSYRHQTAQMASLKEVSIHTNILQATGPHTHPEDFLFLLCTTSATRNLSTHSSDHGFMVYRNERFFNVSATVKNLGDTSRTDYILEKSSPATSQVVDTNLGKSKKNFVSANGEVKQIVQMKSLTSSMTVGLQTTQKKVNMSEALLDLLEMEVTSLRGRVAKLEMEEMKRVFENAERQKQKEEEKRIEEDKQREAEEKQEMDKLLKDLGLSEAQERHERTYVERSMPSLPSIPKLEAGVNPLYVSSLGELDVHGNSFVNFNLQGNDEGASSSNPQSRGVSKVQLPYDPVTKTSGSSSRDEGHTTNNVTTTSNSVVQPMPVHSKPKDPFDFVMNEVKSELSVKQSSRQTRSFVQKSLDVESSHSSSPKTGRAHQNNSTHLCQIPNVSMLERIKPDTNGHGFDNGQMDEHDGPVFSDHSSPATSTSDDVLTISSSPVF